MVLRLTDLRTLICTCCWHHTTVEQVSRQIERWLDALEWVRELQAERRRTVS